VALGGDAPIEGGLVAAPVGQQARALLPSVRSGRRGRLSRWAAAGAGGLVVLFLALSLAIASRRRDAAATLSVARRPVPGATGGPRAAKTDSAVAVASSAGPPARSPAAPPADMVFIAVEPLRVRAHRSHRSRSRSSRASVHAHNRASDDRGHAHAARDYR
jgi:hypothetical protein